MNRHKWLFVAIVFGFVHLAVILTASAEEEFYWKNTYPRGVGTIPPEHACDAGKVEDASLCYTPCKSGYHGKGMKKLKAIKDAVKGLKSDLVESHKGAALVDDLHKAWKALPYKEQLEIKVAIRGLKTTGSIAKGVIDDQMSPIDLLRDAAQIVSIIDEAGLMSVIAAFMYPVYGVDYGKFYIQGSSGFRGAARMRWSDVTGRLVQAQPETLVAMAAGRIQSMARVSRSVGPLFSLL
jgi:hypothetical protein